MEQQREPNKNVSIEDESQFEPMEAINGLSDSENKINFECKRKYIVHDFLAESDDRLVAVPMDVTEAKSQHPSNRAAEVAAPVGEKMSPKHDQPEPVDVLIATLENQAEDTPNATSKELAGSFNEIDENRIAVKDFIYEDRVNGEQVHHDSARIDMSVDELKESDREDENSHAVIAENDEDQLIDASEGNFPNDIPEFKECNFFYSKSVIELSRYTWPSSEKHHYLRGCLFSPDGTCVLTAVNNDGMHVVELPVDLYQAEEVSKKRPLDVLKSAVHVKEGGTVYDMCWYPFMNSSTPETCCWLTSRQHEPIQMYDAFDGSLRCTYRGYDGVDEVEAAISVLFSPDGDQVLGGYKKTLRIFKTNVPGRDSTTVQLKSPAACLAFSPKSNSLIAIGSWNRSIKLYDLRTPRPMAEEELFAHKAGVTRIQFDSTGDMLWSGARRDDTLLGWDLRNPSTPLHTLQRAVNNNQRIYFDICIQDKWLASGSTDGKVRLWDLSEINRGEDSQYILPLHHDSCNGVSLHPSQPVMATSSGQHHFDQTNEGIQMQENSLIFWWHGKDKNE